MEAFKRWAWVAFQFPIVFIFMVYGTGLAWNAAGPLFAFVGLFAGTFAGVLIAGVATELVTRAARLLRRQQIGALRASERGIGTDRRRLAAEEERALRRHH